MRPSVLNIKAVSWGEKNVYYVQACNSEALTRTATNVRTLTAFVFYLLLLFAYLKIFSVARS